MGAIDALAAHGSDDLKRRYLAKLVSGEWTATMNLTEPQAGSDLGALRTRAERGRRRHATASPARRSSSPMASTISPTTSSISCWRACPTRRAGTRGISLFLVPKFLVNADGSLGARNDVRCAGIEHKLGIHASPTCTMVYRRPAAAPTGWLVGEENRGLACMFTMMNNARLERRHAGRRDRRARLPAGARLCPRAPAGPRAGRVAATA